MRGAVADLLQRRGGRGGCALQVMRRGGRRRDWWLGWRLPWWVEGEEKIRVRVLGDEDDDVAESDWLIW